VEVRTGKDVLEKKIKEEEEEEARVKEVQD